MKLYGKNETGSMRGWSSHSFQPLSCSAAASWNDSRGSGRAKISLPNSRAKKPGQNRVVRLANQDKMIAVLLNDHGAALISSEA